MARQPSAAVNGDVDTPLLFRCMKFCCFLDRPYAKAELSARLCRRKVDDGAAVRRLSASFSDLFEESQAARLFSKLIRDKRLQRPEAFKNGNF